MARMYPHSLVGGDQPESEERVFDRLRDALDDDWCVFHSVGWTRDSLDEGLRQGEIDFVLAHPERGILAIEVKGAGVVCQQGAWYRTVDGVRSRAKDPFSQALDHQFALGRALSNSPGLEGLNAAIGHCVIFPFTLLESLPPIADHGLVIDKAGFRDEFSTRLHAVLDRALTIGDRDSLGTVGMAALTQRLAPSFAANRVLGDEIVDTIESLYSLTFEQARVVEGLEGTTKLQVTGFAGSGKTTVAVAKARRLASEGKQVAFVCFNRALADELGQRNSDGGIRFTTFHGLALSLAGKASLGTRTPEPGAEPEVVAEFWEDGLPAALEAAVGEGALGPQFDALVIDEGQDLSNRMLRALEATLREPDSAVIWIFRDDNQQLFNRGLELGNEYAKWRLSVNCRNTRSIHEELLRFYDGEVISRPSGPAGQPVEWVETNDQCAAVLKVLRRLKVEEIPTQDVVVLAPRPLEARSGQAKSSRVGLELSAANSEFTFASGRQSATGAIRFESVGAFKGLEATVAVICEWEGMGGDRGTEREHGYVAISRAVAHCVVIGAPGSFAPQETAC